MRAARFAGVGFEFAGTVVAGLLLGDAIDRYMGTQGVVTVLMTLVALGGAVYRLLWSVKQFSSQSGNDRGSDTHH